LRASLAEAEAKAEAERRRTGAEVQEVRRLQSQLVQARADHDNLLQQLEQEQTSAQHPRRRFPAAGQAGEADSQGSPRAPACQPLVGEAHQQSSAAETGIAQALKRERRRSGALEAQLAEARQQLGTAEAGQEKLVQMARHERRRSKALEAQLAEAEAERRWLPPGAVGVREGWRSQVEVLKTSRNQLVQCLQYKQESARRARAQLELAEAQHSETVEQERQVTAALRERVEAQEPIFIAESEHNKMLCSLLGTLEARFEETAAQQDDAPMKAGDVQCLELEQSALRQLQEQLEASEAERDAIAARLAVADAERAELAQSLSDERVRIGHLRHELEALATSGEAAAAAAAEQASEAASDLADAALRCMEAEASREWLQRSLEQENAAARSLREECALQAACSRQYIGAVGEEAERRRKPRTSSERAESAGCCGGMPACREGAFQELQEQLARGDAEQEKLRQNLKMERRRTRWLQLQLGKQPTPVEAAAASEPPLLRADVATAKGDEEFSFRLQKPHEVGRVRIQLQSQEEDGSPRETGGTPAAIWG